MSRSFPTLEPATNTAQAVRRWLTRSFAGRALLAGAVIKLFALILRLAGASAAIAERIDTVGDLALIVGTLALGWRLFADVKGVLLWRVRRKLTLSYIFIGFVPVFLSLILFITVGLLLFYSMAQYMAGSSITAIVEQAAFLAESAAVGLQGAGDRQEILGRIERRRAGAAPLFPLVSYTVVASPAPCDVAQGGPPPGSLVIEPPVIVGPWAHLDPPETVPGWIAPAQAASATCATEAALLAYTVPASAGDGADGRSASAYLVARAIAWPDTPGRRFAVVVDVPIEAAVLERVRTDTDIDIGAVTAFPCTAASPEADPIPVPLAEGRALGPPRVAPARSASRNPLRRPREWVVFLTFRDWRTGATCEASANLSTTMADLYDRISIADARVGQGLLLLILLVSVLFLIIQGAAFIMGLSLARSITGSIHELFAGTERVRRGDFTHKIAVQSRDQLGELADSFNSMTSSIEDLLREKAEKERMEEELRIARNIQMSLLPHGGLNVPGLSLTAHCEPAREVGGDYYDYLALDDHRVGLLIADVAGKGTSAALYMAELKGLMLSLTQQHSSPRRLLIDANRIISRHLDSRSFITITYAIVDLRERVLTYARAGHCPLIYVPGPRHPSRAAQILAPDGLVLGLQIDNGERFSKLLVESSVPIGPGDLFLFYTDGLTEATDAAGDPFGDARLAELMQDHADLPFEELRERILREIDAFSAHAVQQDDMTMLLLKVEDVGRGRMGAAADGSELGVVAAGRPAM
jgi:sigma-B regulation protein RsbU (phosphoserine phosphatase)